MKCSKCGSTNTIKHGKQWRLDPKPHRIQRYRCKDCGRFTVEPR